MNLELPATGEKAVDTDIRARYIGFRLADGSVMLAWKWEGQLRSAVYPPGAYGPEDGSVTWVELSDVAEPGEGCNDAAGSEVAQVRKES